MKNQDSSQIVCPYCGWIKRQVKAESLKNISITDVVQDTEKTYARLSKKILSKIRDDELKNANAWIDMPPCPNCGNSYQYNFNTRETRQ